MRRRLDAAGYDEVKTPQLMDARQWEQSGHWGKYRENMFVVPDEIPGTEEEAPILSGDADLMALKPMNCPAHILIFRQGIKSLSRPADPARRIRLLPPQRAARRAARHLAGPPVHPGRRPYLLPRGPDRRGDAAVLRPARHRSTAISASPIMRSSSRSARRSGSAATRCGTGPSRTCARRSQLAGRAARRIWLGGAAGRGRLLFAQARIPPDRRDRPDLAVRHAAARLRHARAARRLLCRRGRREAPRRSCSTARSSARSSASSAS